MCLPRFNKLTVSPSFQGSSDNINKWELKLQYTTVESKSNFDGSLYPSNTKASKLLKTIMHIVNADKNLRTMVKNHIISHIGLIYWETVKKNRMLIHSLEYWILSKKHYCLNI